MKKGFAAILAVILIVTSVGCASEPKEKVISVYMLTENEELVNAMKSFSGENPEVSLSFTFGIEDTFKMPSEAKKELNVRFMAGDGPDIIILDDMDGESYAETGQLSDLSEMIAEKEGALPPKLRTHYQVQGKTYYMPLAVSLISESWHQNQHIDFSALKSFVESIGNQGLNIKGISYDNLSAILYRTEMEPYIRENGGVERDVLKRFYLDLGELMALYDGEVDFASFEQTNLKVNHLRSFFRLLDGETDAAVDYIDTLFDAQALYSLKTEERIDFQFRKKDAKKDAQYSYIPQGMISISAQSNHKAEAEALVRYLFSEKGQKELLDRDFIPINLQVLEKSFQVERQYDVNGEVTIYPWGERAKKDFIKVMKKLDEPLLTDANLMEIIMGGAAAYLNGESSLEEALDNTMNKLDIYLAE